MGYKSYKSAHLLLPDPISVLESLPIQILNFFSEAASVTDLRDGGRSVICDCFHHHEAGTLMKCCLMQVILMLIPCSTRYKWFWIAVKFSQTLPTDVFAELEGVLIVSETVNEDHLGG